jgi:hypothetical protein
MVDSFFDLGKNLKQIDNNGLQAHLQQHEEIFELAFTPSGTVEATTPGDTIQFKDKTFKRMRFYEVRFVRVVFTRCVFDECLFMSAQFEDCSFHECRFMKCNTHKFKLLRTYIDPKCFLGDLFDKKKYANVGVDLFHALLKNSVDESQPEFRDLAEYHFRVWHRYNKTHYWQARSGRARWFDFRVYAFWIWSVFFQYLFGFGVRIRNVVFWTLVFTGVVWAINHACWGSFGVDSSKLPAVPLWAKSAFFTVGNLTTFGTAELTSTTTTGLIAVSVQVIVGITWIALSTAMIVRRFVR